MAPDLAGSFKKKNDLIMSVRMAACMGTDHTRPEELHKRGKFIRGEGKRGKGRKGRQKKKERESEGRGLCLLFGP